MTALLSPREMTSETKVEQRPLWSINPSPENDRLYRPVDPSDPAIVALAKSITDNGFNDPIHITLDGYIVSGHRRYAAAKLTGLDEVPVIVRPFSRCDDIDAFVKALRDANLQRVKSFDELIREEVVSADPSEAYERLQNFRKQNSDKSGFSKSELKIGERKDRCRISRAKMPMLEAALKIIDDLREFWPLSDRQIHYAMLNHRPLKHVSKPKSAYKNDRASYGDLCDLLTRARLTGDAPWNAIADETRSVELWRVHPNPQPFIKSAMDGMLQGYWRDLQQSQPCHIEIVAEKLTIKTIVQQVAIEYCIPVTIGRGYCSINPRREMAQRFCRSGREQLIVLILSDFDPDGETIAESFARSLRDDFCIKNITPIKVALNAKQVKQLKLPPAMKAKAGSSRFAEFTAKHGHNVFELEAVDPTELQRILRDAIDSVLDIDAFNAEVEQEKQDAAELEDRRRIIMKVIGNSDTEN